ncbi:diguanylate cyclase domain-containing protein [Roseospirillum parvum]|uniref:PAS domain S-box-containing protein/diguanylate cyclase (GGDEF) domain-containing protein n=1 Tax=Roseospirillum parvum TaxID=83401 RepID=A0A1G8B995_9PROT|nr:diguanylate cyclase [Roseospirillum parvum]SDH29170.1 PAS domain S-box-containing protein/diguanylate cyclase (GGDEF) domain-containing protein [Roseospirillum parvum]
MSPGPAPDSQQYPPPDTESIDLGWARLDTDALAAVDAPVVGLDSDGVVRTTNPAAEALLASVETPQLEALGRLSREIARGGRVGGDLVLDLPDGPRRFKVLSLPLALAPGKRADAAGRGALIVLDDVTLEHNLRAALVESRQRYKDFVEIGSDFAWETDAHGQFTFVSPKGALGYSAETLVGCDPYDLALEGMGTDNLPFFTRQPVEEAELWLQRADGAAACVIATAAPLFDQRGRWSGVRGVCRDVTGERRRSIAQNQARHREMALAHMARAFRDLIQPDEMLAVAAEKVARGLGVTACHIFRLAGADPAAVSEAGRHDAGSGHFMAGGSWGALPSRAAEPIVQTVSEGADLLEVSEQGHRVLAVPTRYHQRINGVLIVWRAAGRGPWSEDDRLLVADIAEQIGITNEQVAQHEFMLRISRTDALTGLFNRRAFSEEVERRLQRAEHATGGGALLYVDLDNFKPVNDQFGHQKGDAVLIRVRELLLGHTRPTDLVARLGGDEFAIWLEGADRAVAEAKAQSLIEAAATSLANESATGQPLSLSIGLALPMPGVREDLNALAHRADEAMYAAKRAGKAAWRTASDPGPGGPGAPADDGP